MQVGTAGANGEPGYGPVESTSAVKVAVVVSMSWRLLCRKMPWQMVAPALQTSLPQHVLALEPLPALFWWP